MLKNIKILREENNISQQKLADEIGMSQQSINKYENHNIEPDIETLKKIANYFNTSIDYVVGYTDIRTKIELITRYDLNNQESKLIDKFRNLSIRHKQSMLRLADDFLNK